MVNHEPCVTTVTQVRLILYAEVESVHTTYIYKIMKAPLLQTISITVSLTHVSFVD
jgi:hypothetical protein